LEILFLLPSRKREAHGEGDLKILFPLPPRRREAHGEGDFGKSFFHRLPASAKHMVRSL
jgi:hypothetical protein